MFAEIAEAGPGIIIEDKGYSLALHYRLAPDKEDIVLRAVAAICAALPGTPIELLPGKSMVEIKQVGFNKASGVRELMSYPPFAGRRPIFIGDDITDETVFAMLPEIDGLPIVVGRSVPGVDLCFDSPTDVRAWLERLSRNDGPARTMTDHGLDLAVIGNGRTAALVDPTARIMWWCFPRFDSDPIFCRLLSGSEEKGFADVVLDDMVDFKSEYVRNTAIVTTLLTDRQGGAVRVTDFAPRFRQFGRMFRPPQLFRIIEPVAGLPRITIRVRPTNDYGHPVTRHAAGSNHIRYIGDSTVIRLTTDAPLALIEREAPFVLTRPMHLVFGFDEPFPGDLQTTVTGVLRPHRRLLDQLGARAVDLLRLAGRDHPRRHHVEIEHLRGDRRHHRGPYHLDPRSCQFRPHLGLPLLLASRRLFRRQGAQSHRRDPNHGGLHLLHSQHRVEPKRAAAAGLQRGPHRAVGRANGAGAHGIPGRRSGPRRQCRGRPGSE